MSDEQGGLGQTHAFFEKHGSALVTSDSEKARAAGMSQKPITIIDMDTKQVETRPSPASAVPPAKPAAPPAKGRATRTKRRTLCPPSPLLPDPTQPAAAIEWQEPGRADEKEDTVPGKFFQDNFLKQSVTFILQAGVEATTEAYMVKFNGPSVVMVVPIRQQIKIRPPAGTQIRFRHEGKEYAGESFELFYDFPELEISILVFMIKD